MDLDRRQPGHLNSRRAFPRVYASRNTSKDSLIHGVIYMTRNPHDSRSTVVYRSVFVFALRESVAGVCLPLPVEPLPRLLYCLGSYLTSYARNQDL